MTTTTWGTPTLRAALNILGIVKREWRPDEFCRISLAQDRNGTCTSPTSAAAVRWCIRGRIHRAALVLHRGEAEDPAVSCVWYYLAAEAQAGWDQDEIYVNDLLGYEETIKLLDRTILRLVAEIAASDRPTPSSSGPRAAEPSAGSPASSATRR